jgi:hypothetical protein
MRWSVAVVCNLALAGFTADREWTLAPHRRFASSPCPEGVPRSSNIITDQEIRLFKL